MNEQVAAARQSGPEWWRKGVYIGAVVAAFNAVLYLTGYWLHVVPRPSLLISGAQPGLAVVLALTLLAVFAAFALYRILETRMRRPIPAFLGALVPVVIFSFIATTAMADWSRAQVALFELMHIAVFTAVLVALWEWRPRAVGTSPH